MLGPGFFLLTLCLAAAAVIAYPTDPNGDLNGPADQADLKDSADQADLNGLSDQNSFQPSSVLRLATTSCSATPFEYYDVETLTCESCGVICRRPRSDHCLKEPNCQVDGRWNCNKTFECDANCESPTTQLQNGSTVWHGEADCGCDVQEALGGLPCQGIKRTQCTIDIADKCQRERDKRNRLWLTNCAIGIGSPLAIVVILGILGFFGWRSHSTGGAVKKWIDRVKIWWRIHDPVPDHDPIPGEQGADIAEHNPIPFSTEEQGADIADNAEQPLN